LANSVTGSLSASGDLRISANRLELAGGVFAGRDAVFSASLWVASGTRYPQIATCKSRQTT